MGNDHHRNVTNKQIELVEMSEGGVSWSDTENMYLDEFEYVIYTYKTIFEQKQKNKQEQFKSIMEFATKGMETLFKLLVQLGGRGK